MQTQNRENISGIHVVPTVESKFPRHQHIGFSILQKVKIHCKIWDGEIHLYRTQELILLKEMWYHEMGK